jgi:hypothetical protein
VVNSRFRISFHQNRTEAQALSAWSAEAAAPTKDLPTKPLVGGPPALQTEIEEKGLFLPIILR